MGYILPVQHIQAELYANRMNAVRNNYAHIGRIEKVELNLDVMGKFKHSLHDEKERVMVERKAVTVKPIPPYMKEFINPNPANLSSEITKLIGKGLTINEYI
ncbi:hypothetical protein [Sporosarcina sp. UB5]|uniref:hypothetical protein n=1 Tax=Sporosarcina sp. UB5 TaxID=3047463 RepID=UPI003D7AF792